MNSKMALKSIRISGFLGIPHDEKLAITVAPLGRMNILIGPNNAGKSSIIRFLMKFAGWLNKGAWEVDAELNGEDCWRYDYGVSAEIILDSSTVTTDDNSIMRNVVIPSVQNLKD